MVPNIVNVATLLLVLVDLLQTGLGPDTSLDEVVNLVLVGVQQPSLLQGFPERLRPDLRLLSIVFEGRDIAHYRVLHHVLLGLGVVGDAVSHGLELELGLDGGPLL